MPPLQQATGPSDRRLPVAWRRIRRTVTWRKLPSARDGTMIGLDRIAVNRDAIG
jgi:hypothetical protein